jgi:predicted dehydrogenase
MAQIQIGVLGAARIVPNALIAPARKVPDVRVVAVAARDIAKAQSFAKKNDIPQAHASYDALLADPAIAAVYIPLPNGLHGAWTIKALEAGKHVLCEKPFTANTDEAAQVAQIAAAHPNRVSLSLSSVGGAHAGDPRQRRIGQVATAGKLDVLSVAALHE